MAGKWIETYRSRSPFAKVGITFYSLALGAQRVGSAMNYGDILLRKIMNLRDCNHLNGKKVIGITNLQNNWAMLVVEIQF